MPKLRTIYGRELTVYSNEEIATALIAHCGLTSYAADALKMNPESLRVRIKGSKVLQRARDTGREVLKDKAEHGLIKAIENGDPWAIKFFLMTQGKDRGYGERLDLHADQPIPLIREIVVERNAPKQIEAPADEETQPLVIDVESRVVEDGNGYHDS